MDKLQSLKVMTDAFEACIAELGMKGLILKLGCQTACTSPDTPLDDRSLWEKRAFLLRCFMLIIVNLGLDLEGLGEESLLDKQGGEALRDRAVRFYEFIKGFQTC